MINKVVEENSQRREVGLEARNNRLDLRTVYTDECMHTADSIDEVLFSITGSHCADRYMTLN